MKENLLIEKSEQFAIRIVNMYKYLCEEKREYVLSKQLLRCGTSIGANIAESRCAISDKDFLSKLYVALKEASETLYWLRLIHNTDYIEDLPFRSIYADGEELLKLLQSITKTLKNKSKQKSDPPKSNTEPNNIYKEN